MNHRTHDYVRDGIAYIVTERDGIESGVPCPDCLSLDVELLHAAMQAHQDANGPLPEYARYHCGGTCGYDIARHLVRLSQLSDERVGEAKP